MHAGDSASQSAAPRLCDPPELEDENYESSDEETEREVNESQETTTSVARVCPTCNQLLDSTQTVNLFFFWFPMNEFFVRLIPLQVLGLDGEVPQAMLFFDWTCLVNRSRKLCNTSDSFGRQW